MSSVRYTIDKELYILIEKERLKYEKRLGIRIAKAKFSRVRILPLVKRGLI